jgi:hypothetical protein
MLQLKPGRIRDLTGFWFHGFTPLDCLTPNKRSARKRRLTRFIGCASIERKHSEAKQFEMHTRVGYISARIIQLGYIQWDVTVLQEYYDTQSGERT